MPLPFSKSELKVSKCWDFNFVDIFLLTGEFLRSQQRYPNQDKGKREFLLL